MCRGHLAEEGVHEAREKDHPGGKEGRGDETRRRAFSPFEAGNEKGEIGGGVDVHENLELGVNSRQLIVGEHHVGIEPCLLVHVNRWPLSVR